MIINNNPYSLKIILLAAGKSERFEAIKLLANIKNQTNSIPLIQHVLQQITASLTVLNIDKSSLHIATGGYHEQIYEIIGNQLSLTYCSDAHLGLGHTIAQSVNKVVSSDDSTSHVMITLADQVDLNSEDYIRLIEQSLSMPTKLVCASAGLEIMPPAIFPSQYFAQLKNLTGDKGAKALLHKNKENLEKVLMSNAAVDIDTKQDLINWHEKGIKL
jgi:molybdenum cofactor cytidylyltransferase